MDTTTYSSDRIPGGRKNSRSSPSTLAPPGAPPRSVAASAPSGRRCTRAPCACPLAQPADDIVQETMLRALRFEDQYHAGTNLRAWVGQVLVSVFPHPVSPHQARAARPRQPHVRPLRLAQAGRPLR